MESFEVSKLLPSSRLMGELKANGTLAHLDGRCVGKSTGLALSLVGEALSNPNMLITSHQKTQCEANSLVTIITSTMCKLGLKCISVRAKDDVVELRYSGTKTVITYKGDLYVKT